MLFVAERGRSVHGGFFLVVHQREVQVVSSLAIRLRQPTGRPEACVHQQMGVSNSHALPEG